jgi:AcrR family transcriptional regulator
LSRDRNTACSTNHIAERAGISIGTLYRYFDDKHAVFEALFARELRKDTQAIEAVLKEFEGEPIEVVVPRIIGVTLERLGERPRLRQVLTQEFATSKQRKERTGIKMHLARVLTNYLRAHPQFRIPHSIRLEMLIIVNAVEAAIYAAIWEYGPILKRSRLVSEVSDLVLRYLSKYRVS